MAIMATATALLGVLWPLPASAVALFALNMYNYWMFSVQILRFTLGIFDNFAMKYFRCERSAANPGPIRDLPPHHTLEADVLLA